MSTPVSSATAYATPQDLIDNCEVAKIGDWATDRGKRLTPQEILTDPVIAKALRKASGRVEASCLRGGHYTAADLAVLNGVSKDYLSELVCDLAAYILAKRRIPKPEEIAGYKEAKEALLALNNGEQIFALQEVMDAGVTSDKIDLQYDSSNQLARPTEQAGRLFGRRMDNRTFGNQD